MDARLGQLFYGKIALGRFHTASVVVGRLVFDTLLTGHLPYERRNEEKHDVNVGGERTPPRRKRDARFGHNTKLERASSLEMVFGIQDLLKHKRRDRDQQRDCSYSDPAVRYFHLRRNSCVPSGKYLGCRQRPQGVQAV